MKKIFGISALIALAFFSCDPIVAADGAGDDENGYSVGYDIRK